MIVSFACSCRPIFSCTMKWYLGIMLICHTVLNILIVLPRDDKIVPLKNTLLSAMPIIALRSLTQQECQD